MKRISRHDWPELNIRVHLHSYRETAVLATPRRSRHSLSELTLDHKDRVLNHRPIREEVKHNVRRKYVRNVTEHEESLADSRKINLSHILIDDSQLRVLLGEVRAEVWLNLNHGESSRVNEPRGERSHAGTYFNKPRVLLRSGEIHDLVYDLRSNEKILSTFFGWSNL